MASSSAQGEHFFVTRESQTSSDCAETSYIGLRDLTDLEKIKELDIVGPKGTLRGIKNRVRAGLATFENRGTPVKTNTEQGKIVVYTTSIRTVRKTYEECKYVLSIFHNLRVHVEERDIYVNEFHHRGLEERLGLKNILKLPVPQIYINGQHIGGATEFEVLNETRELRKLIANIPRQESSTVCLMCGGYEFVPCRKCGGSKNSVSNEFTVEFRALKCTYCTENGLEPCPACEKRRLNLKDVEDVETETVRKEKELKAQKEKEEAEREKRERIKREALEAEHQAQLEREKEENAKKKKKERAKREKERKKKAAEMRQRVAEEIARELEREKQWKTDQQLKAINDSSIKETEAEVLWEGVLLGEEDVALVEGGVSGENMELQAEQVDSQMLQSLDANILEVAIQSQVAETEENSNCVIDDMIPPTVDDMVPPTVDDMIPPTVDDMVPTADQSIVEFTTELQDTSTDGRQN